MECRHLFMLKMFRNCKQVYYAIGITVTVVFCKGLVKHFAQSI